jgi:hypothetical protein
MSRTTMSETIKGRVQAAARQLGTADPVTYIGALIERSFPLPPGSPHYAANTLTPGAVPVEPSYSEQEPHVLRLTISPLVGSSPISRRDEATREMRRLVGPLFGHDALRWFDQRSEEWRSMMSSPHLEYGAWFGTAYDEDGLYASKVYYELHPEQMAALPISLRSLVQSALQAMPRLIPVFTSIRCGRDTGSQRVTFAPRGPLRLNDLAPLLNALGLGHQLPGIMQVVGLCLGGRFELPDNAALLGLRETSEGPELKFEVLLGMIPDLPPNFLNLLALGLAERPRQLAALGRWLHAFTPEDYDWPGDFSVLSIRTTARTPARVSLYLRPIEFEIRQRLSNVPGFRQDPYDLNAGAAAA